MAICPIFSAADKLRIVIESQEFKHGIPGSVVEPQDVNCIGNRCAAWNEDQERCGLSNMSR